MGVRYKYYCSNIGRTFLIDPTKTQERNYEFLLELQHRVMETIRDGVKIKDIYLTALSHIKNKRPDLEAHFTKNAGFAMGIEFRESNYVLNGKNLRELKNGMVLNVSIGFDGLENKEATDELSKKYSLLIIDTIRVTNEMPILLTECSKRLNEISYFIKEDESMEGGGEDNENKKDNNKSTKSQNNSNTNNASSSLQRSDKKDPPAKTAILRSKFRSEDHDDETKEQRRKEHQKQLFAQKQADGLAKFSEDKQSGNEDHKPVFRKFESYRSEAKLPREVKDLRVSIKKEKKKKKKKKRKEKWVFNIYIYYLIIIIKII